MPPKSSRRKPNLERPNKAMRPIPREAEVDLAKRWIKKGVQVHRVYMSREGTPFGINVELQREQNNYKIRIIHFDAKHEPTVVGTNQVFVDRMNKQIAIHSGDNLGSIHREGGRLSGIISTEGSQQFRPVLDFAIRVARDQGMRRIVLSTVEPKLAKYFKGFGFVQEKSTDKMYHLHLTLPPAQ